MKKVQGPKLPKGVDQTFMDEVDKLNNDQLAGRVLQLQLSNAENEAFKESIEYLAAKDRFDMERERWNEVAGPVRDVSIAIKNKTKIVIARLKEKGGA